MKFKTYEEAVRGLDDLDLLDCSQLSLARESDGWTVAHELAWYNNLPKELKIDFSEFEKHGLEKMKKLIGGMQGSMTTPKPTSRNVSGA